jgi:hypothetical protein
MLERLSTQEVPAQEVLTGCSRPVQFAPIVSAQAFVADMDANRSIVIVLMLRKPLQ